MKNRFVFLTILLLSLVFRLSAEAQFSLKPSPLPACKSFLLTEIGYYFRVSSFPEELSFYKHHSYFTSNVGLMINLNSRFSLGAANFLGLDNDGNVRWGAKARARRWFGAETSAELALGINFADSRSYYERPAFSGELTLNLRDLLIFNVLIEVANYKIPEYAVYEPYGLLGYNKGTDTAIYTGIKTGRKVGLIANVGVAVAYAVLIGIYALSGGSD